MTQLYRLRGAFVKAEPTPTVDSVPVAATDSVLCRKIEPKLLDQLLVDRELIRGFFGQFTSLTGATFGGLTLEVEAAGFGTAGPTTPTPALDALIRICGHSRTVNAGTSVLYAPVSSAIPTATVYYYQAGKLHKFLGAFGDMGIEMGEDQAPFFRFELTGIFVPPTDAALPAFNTAGYIQPLLCNSQNTPTVSIRGFNAELRSFSFKTNAVLEKNALMGGARRITFIDRKAAGSIEIRDTTVAVKDWLADITSASLGPMAIVHGTVAGNKIGFASAAGLQLTNPRTSEDRGMTNLTMDARFVPSAAGNDEYSIAVS